MTRARKYRQGAPFADMADLTAWLDGGGWVWWRARPKHPAVIANMQYRVLRNMVRGFNGLPLLWRAEPIEAEVTP